MKKIVCGLLVIIMFLGTCYAEAYPKILEIGDVMEVVIKSSESVFETNQTYSAKHEYGTVVLVALSYKKAQQDGKTEMNFNIDNNLIGYSGDTYWLYSYTNNNEWIVYEYDLSHCQYITISNTSYEEMQERCELQCGKNYFEFNGELIKEALESLW